MKIHCLVLSAAAMSLAAFVPSLGAQPQLSTPPEKCAPAVSAMTASAWLDRAVARVMPASTDGRVLRYRAGQDAPFWNQSDRMYEPFVPNMTVTARWYDPNSGVEARQATERPVKPGENPSFLFTRTAAFTARDTAVRPMPAFFAISEVYRRHNPWSVLAEWRADAAGARVAERCVYRDAWRVVLERNKERLYLSESDATPIKLERVEPDVLWGQTKTEYLWSTWWGLRSAGGGQFPLATFRIMDGAVYERVGVQQGSAALVPRDSAPRLVVPNAAAMSEAAPVETILMPDTVRVAERTYLLVTPQYTQTVTLQRDTVFLFDATTSEARARGDSAMIAALFPGRHPTVVVVTDLAWPHISGVRFWVARGATLVSHRASESFLKRVFDKKWTLAPDALEKSRATARFRFRAVDDSLQLAGGALMVHALRGTSTETAVGVWMPEPRYFWAGDYVQNSPDSPYARDILATVKALRLAPLKLGAQHIKLTEWAEFEARK
jgi:hypothetical protein